jgi:hypothetical protein
MAEKSSIYRGIGCLGLVLSGFLGMMGFVLLFAEHPDRNGRIVSAGNSAQVLCALCASFLLFVVGLYAVVGGFDTQYRG